MPTDEGAPSTDLDERLLAEQIRYYEERAPIYEQLYFLQGRYAVEDPAVAATWHRETATLEGFVEGLDASGASSSSPVATACGRDSSHHGRRRWLRWTRRTG